MQTVKRTRGRPKKVHRLDADELSTLRGLLARALPQHYALYRTKRDWHLYRWDAGTMRFRPYWQHPDLTVLLDWLAQQHEEEPDESG